MNIAFCISSLKYGGAEKQAVLDANLISEKHNAYLIYFQKGPLEKLVNEKVNMIQVSKDNYLFTSFRLVRIIMKRKIGNIHSSLFAAIVTTTIASLFIRKVNIFWHFHSHEYRLPLLNRWLYKWLSRIKAVRKIMFVNSELRSFQTERFGFNVLKTDILYNMTSIHSLVTTSMNNGICTIGYIGRLVSLKRVHFLLECADHLRKKGVKDLMILIVGDGPERQNLEEYAKRLGVDGFIKFAGFRTDTYAYYGKMDVFALASDEECLSMAAIDAGVMGIPSVAFSVGGNSEIINDGETGFIVNTKDEFFEKIYFLVSNQSARNQMGNNAKKYCFEKFGRDNHLQKLISLYNEFKH